MLCELWKLSKRIFVKRNIFRCLSSSDQDITTDLTGLLALAVYEAIQI